MAESEVFLASGLRALGSFLLFSIQKQGIEEAGARELSDFLSPFTNHILQPKQRGKRAGKAVLQQSAQETGTNEQN